ncbi:MAG: hypothetical protein HY821_09130, partial [Acidobacteria bacterium]|nr:hypothetical protein [Acidobacteriota bacterium]
MPGGGEELSLERGKLSYCAVVPGKVEFAVEVRRRITAEKPEVVAVELPVWLERPYRAAVGRLPEMSVIVYPDPTDDDRGIYIPVEPADPFT